MLDSKLLNMRFILTLIALLGIVGAIGAVLYFAVTLDKLQLTILVMLLTGLRDELKTSFAWFFDGVAKAMGGETTTTITPEPQPPVKETP